MTFRPLPLLGQVGSFIVEGLTHSAPVPGAAGGGGGALPKEPRLGGEQWLTRGRRDRPRLGGGGGGHWLSSGAGAF